MSATLTQHPLAIRQLAEQLGLNPDQFIDETHVGRRGFFRYGRKEADACRYCLDPEDGHLIGLCIRGQGVKDLKWMEEEAFHQIEDLYCGENEFSRLDVPASWTKLRRIDLSGSPQLSRVRFLGAADRLERLEITDSGLVGLSLPTSGCPQLQFLDLSRNAELTGLTLTGPCFSLHSLHLRAAPKLETLAVNTSLPSLDTLELVGCEQLASLPAAVILNSPLDRLYLKGCRPRNCPSYLCDNSSLAGVKAWFRALAEGSEPNDRVKLLITGNGDVGKSTIQCALSKPQELYCTCTDEHKTTHGIQIGTFKHDGIEFSYWDFGGQDVYGATHRLFFADEAVQLLVFDPRYEQMARRNKQGSDRAHGLEQKHPLEYYHTVQRQKSSSDTFVIVQNKKRSASTDPEIDYAQPDERLVQYAKDHLQDRFHHVDALEGPGMNGLLGEIVKLGKQLPRYGMPFPRTWLDVRTWFTENDQPGPDKRQRITTRFFREEICVPRGVTEVVAQEYLLKFLQSAGYCYVIDSAGREDTEDGDGPDIIVDQEWALEAIYQPLDRDVVGPLWEQLEGRIPENMIFATLGDTLHQADKQLLLRFMEDNALCFRTFDDDRTEAPSPDDRYYIFPTYLPREPHYMVPDFWNQCAAPPNWRADLPYRDLPAMHALICALGRKTAHHQLWRSGIDLRLIDTREKEEGQLPLPNARVMITLVNRRAEEAGSQLVVNFNNEEAIAWWPSVQEWINEHFRDLNWQANEAARTQVQGEGLKSRVGEPVAIEQIPDANGVPVLWFFSTPVGAPAIPAQAEYGRVMTSLQGRGNKCRGHYAFMPEQRLTYSKLIRDVKDVNPRLLHFTGHGDKEGLLFHNEDDTDIQRISPSDLASAFRNVARHIREDGKEPRLVAVLLNSCLSVPEAEAISRENLYVIGYEEKLKSTLANTFAVAFYERLAETNDVTLAFNYGVSVGQGNRSGDADNYQLYYQGKNITP